MLSEATCDRTGLIALEGPVSPELVLEKPLSSEVIGVRGPRNEIPGVVLHESRVLVFHGSPPIRVAEGAAVCARYWGQRHAVVDAGEAVADFGPSCHVVFVGDGLDRNNTLGQRRCARGLR